MSRRLSRQRTRDTAPEIALRKRLHALGMRYRVDVAPLPGLRRRADLVFSKARVAVFVDGCFWHRCPIHGTEPRSNAAWWKAKLDTNVARDRHTDARLADAGWSVIRVWEHDDPTAAAAIVEATVHVARASRSGHLRDRYAMVNTPSYMDTADASHDIGLGVEAGHGHQQRRSTMRTREVGEQHQ